MAISSRHARRPTGEDQGPADADSDSGASRTAPALPAKKPWQAPHVRTGHLFESNSLACGKNTPQLEQCLQNPLNS